MSNLLKTPIFIKQCIDSPQEFSRGSNDRLFIGFTLSPLLKVIFPKVRTASFHAASHYPEILSASGKRGIFRENEGKIEQ